MVDPDGKPLDYANIDYTANQSAARQTGVDGRFALETRAPAIVVRKPGYHSALLRIREATDARVTLRRVDRAFPTCPPTGEFETIQQWGALFRFAKMPQVTAGPQGSDIDYGMRWYLVETAAGPRGIRHGSGASWSMGFPSAIEVWRSVVFEEAWYPAGGVSIVDARGSAADGKHWRYLGREGESADYRDVDEAAARILDQFLDGPCMLRTGR